MASEAVTSERGAEEVTRYCWAFLRTMAQDYGDNPYRWRKLGPEFNPHLLCFLMSPDLPQRVCLFGTRWKARAHGAVSGERGRAVRVRVTITEER
jgi:hypothetical protein